MCNRCNGIHHGYQSILAVWEILGLSEASPLWIRVLWPEEPTAHPRYLVESSGRIVAIQEPGCACWHIRTAADDPYVNDTCPPFSGAFDKCFEDEGGAFQFDTADHDWS
jgi:hypothetical protein